MITFRKLLVLLILTGGLGTHAQQVSFHARDSSYAGSRVQILIASNPFIAKPSFSRYLTPGPDGILEYDFPIERPRVVQFETGIYQAWILMEPGWHYEIELPPFRERTRSEQVSPFFQSTVIPLKVKYRRSLSTGQVVPGALEINRNISRFDSLFVLKNQELLLSRKRGMILAADSLIRLLEEPFVNDSSRFFKDYRKYRYGLLKLNEGQSRLEDLSLSYLGPTVQADHPGFVELFRVLFKDFLYHYSSRAEGSDIRHLINREQQFREVRKRIRQHPAVWSDSLADLILIQEFSGLFYRGDYHKEALLMMLDSMAAHPVSPELSLYATEVRAKLSSLMTGQIPPDFALVDQQGDTCSLEDFHGKYVYLFFGTPEHYGCMMEYPFLESYRQKHRDYLEVVGILVSDRQEEIADFMARNAYSWRALHHDGSPGLLSDYLIRAYPMAYLIDRNGKMLLSPAMLPSDGFEQSLFRIMRSRGEI